MIDFFIGWSQILSMVSFVVFMSVNFKLSPGNKKRGIIYLLSWVYVSILLNLWILNGQVFEDLWIKLLFSSGSIFILLRIYYGVVFCQNCSFPVIVSGFSKVEDCPKCKASLHDKKSTK